MDDASLPSQRSILVLRACQSAPSLATLCAEEALAATRRSMRNRAAAPGTPPLPLEDGVRLEACLAASSFGRLSGPLSTDGQACGGWCSSTGVCAACCKPGARMSGPSRCMCIAKTHSAPPQSKQSRRRVYGTSTSSESDLPRTTMLRTVSWSDDAGGCAPKRVVVCGSLTLPSLLSSLYQGAGACADCRTAARVSSCGQLDCSRHAELGSAERRTAVHVRKRRWGGGGGGGRGASAAARSDGECSRQRGAHASARAHQDEQISICCAAGVTADTESAALALFLTIYRRRLRQIDRCWPSYPPQSCRAVRVCMSEGPIISKPRACRLPLDGTVSPTALAPLRQQHGWQQGSTLLRRCLVEANTEGQGNCAAKRWAATSMRRLIRGPIAG